MWGERFTLGMLRQKKNLELFFHIQRKTLNTELDKLTEAGLLAAHKKRRRLTPDQVKTILLHLDGTDVNKLIS